MSEISLKTNRSRSEQVRARRQQSSPARPTHAARPAVRSAPPVVSRRVQGRVTTPAYKRVGSRTRRSFSVSMESGAELVLGSLPNVQIGWRTLSGLLVVILVGLVMFLTNSATFRVSAPEVVGITRVSPADLLAVTDLVNRPIYMVDPQVAAAQISQAFPQLVNVNVQVGFPASVMITAEERQPVLAWEYNGPVVWIDRDGFIFESPGDLSGLPIIHADDLPPFQEIKTEDEEKLGFTASSLAPSARQMDAGLLQAALQIGSSVPAGSDVIYKPLEGFGWNDAGGWRVFIGTDLSNLQVKLRIYQAITQTLAERGITPTMISVAQPDAPFYRVE